MRRRHLILGCCCLVAQKVIASAQQQLPEYFPAHVFSDRSDSDSFINQWYSKHLRAMQEPSLFPAQPGAEVYRFTWLRTFSNPMVFRLNVVKDGTASLAVKRANGKGGYEPGTIDLNETLALNAETVAKLQYELRRMDFWNKPARLKTIGMDGAQWIVEANANGNYKLVDRWTESDGDLQDWCRSLIALSGVEVGDVY